MSPLLMVVLQPSVLQFPDKQTHICTLKQKVDPETSIQMRTVIYDVSFHTHNGSYKIYRSFSGNSDIEDFILLRSHCLFLNFRPTQVKPPSLPETSIKMRTVIYDVSFHTHNGSYKIYRSF